MGYFKNKEIESNELAQLTGLMPDCEKGQKFACSDITSDVYVKKFIEEHGHLGICSYTGIKALVVDIVDLAEFAVGKIKRYFRHQDEDNLFLESTFYDDDDETIPGLQRVNHYVTREDALYFESTEDLLCAFDFSMHEDCIADVASCIYNDTWINIDSFSLREDEVLYINWIEFANKVKLDNGYIPSTYEDMVKAISEGHEPPFDHVLRDIIDIIVKSDCLKTIPNGTLIYRCRNIDVVAEIKDSFMDMTSAPDDYAAANRMSAKGDSLFYGAFDIDVCRLEAVDRSKPIQAVVSFCTKKPLLVIDLTEIPDISLWSEYNYVALKFLSEFTDKISENYADYSTEEKEVEYLPTQAFAKAIREMRISDTQQRVAGLLYPSSKVPTGKNVVFFCNQKESSHFLMSCMLKLNFSTNHKQ